MKARGEAVRFVAFVIALAVWVFAAPNQSKATTVGLPLNGLFEVIGDIPNPTSITLVLTATPILPIPPPPYQDIGFGTSAPGWFFGGQVQQSGGAGGPFFLPQGCIGSTCGGFAGFFGCGGNIGCGILLVTGTFVVGNGQPFSISISDSSRFLLIQASVFTNIPFDFELTADLSDNLGVIPVPVLGGGGGNNGSPTPLPAALPLFATGLGALGLLGWRRKRRATAVAAA